MNLKIESTNDFRELAKLNETVQAWHNQNYPDEFKPFNLSDIEQAFESILENQDFYAFIARLKEEPIGYMIANIKTRPETAFQYKKTILNIDQIAIVTEHQKSGVARKRVV